MGRQLERERRRSSQNDDEEAVPVPDLPRLLRQISDDHRRGNDRVGTPTANEYAHKHAGSNDTHTHSHSHSQLRTHNRRSHSQSRTVAPTARTRKLTRPTPRLNLGPGAELHQGPGAERRQDGTPAGQRHPHGAAHVPDDPQPPVTRPTRPEAPQLT